MSDRTTMPIMGATLLSEVPFAMLVPREAQAQRNHAQTLEVLAQRGGLSTGETLAILTGHKWGEIAECIENETALINRVREWRIAERNKVKQP